MPYEPLVIPEGEHSMLTTRQYAEFLDYASLESGIRLFLDRRRRRPDFPYFDTKFNPNTGEPHPDRNYDFLLGWFIGRGGEAAATHLRIVGGLGGLADVGDEAGEMLDGIVRASTDAILGMLEANGGRCPFRVDRAFRAIDASGNKLTPDPAVREPSDVFCAKALIASGIPDRVAIGKRLFEEFMEACYDFRYVTESTSHDATLASESCFMLAFGAIPLLVEQTSSPEELAHWAATTARMIRFVLGRHYDQDTARFSEFVSLDGREKTSFLGPGHASELVGLGLQAIEAIRDATTEASQDARDAFALAEREFPRLLLQSFALGYNARHHGISQSVDNQTGEVLNDQLPWWSLPETMRAAVRAAAVPQDPARKRKLLDIACTMSNDYYAHYPNPNLLLFPYRTRSGSTGDVVDIMPVVTEADPLYHTNLALIDMKVALGRLSLE